MSTDFKFQDTLIDRLVTNGTAGPNTFIAMDGGLGKTRCAVLAAKKLGMSRGWVVCPKIGLVSWPAELEKWWPEAHFATVSDPDLVPRHDQVPHAHTWLVTPYSEVSRRPQAFIEAAKRFAPDVLVPDEAQALANLYDKNGDMTARTVAVYGPKADLVGGMAGEAQIVWPMSGTPAPNYTAELWTHLNALAPQTIAHPTAGRPLSYQEFIRRYSTTRLSAYGQHITGSVNTLELRRRTASFFHRVRKRDVLPDLPPVLWTAEPLPITADQASNHLDIPEGLDDAALLDWLRQAYPHGSSERKAMGLAKVAGAVEWADAFLQSCDRKLILFAWHTEVVEAITEGLRALGYNPVMVHGGVSTGDRTAAVKAFQTDDQVRVIVGQMLALGTSVTLTAASDVGFVEDDWTPGNMEQAAWRADRIGQTRGVVARVLYVPGSKDEKIAKSRVRKAREFDKMFN
jgi:SWI/SNF-related matrix-associated actin-dependent regulator 1 of chromatin subfamily A